jgi:hypothetical protein
MAYITHAKSSAMTVVFASLEEAGQRFGSKARINPEYRNT